MSTQIASITRRSVLGLGAAGLATSGIAGCGRSETENAEAPPDAGEQLSGSIVMWIYPLAETADEEWYEPHIDAFGEKYPNVEVQVVVQPWESREEQLTTALTGGDAPDVCYMTPDFLPRFATEGVLLGLDDLREDWDVFSPISRESLSYEGTLYAAPIYSQASATFANARILEELGIEGPTTWDELRSAGEAAKTAGYYLTEYLGEDTLNKNFYPYLWQAGGDVLTEDASASALNGPEALEALEFIKEMVDNEWVPREALSVTPPLEQSELAQGNVVYSIGQYLLPDVLGVMEDEIQILSPMEHKQPVAIGSFGALSIFNSTDAPEAAAAWVHELTEPNFINPLCADFAFYSPREDVVVTHEDIPQADEFDEYLDDVHPEVIHPQSREIMDSLKPIIQEVLLQGKDPQAGLEEMESAINGLLERA